MVKPPLVLCLLCALLFCASLLLPAAADARAGFTRGGVHSSIGSRGARTYEPGIGRPLTRSPVTRSPAPVAGAGGMVARHPFLSGLFGSFLGALLFRHGGLFGLGLVIVLAMLVLSGIRGRRSSRSRAAPATLFSGPAFVPRRPAPWRSAGGPAGQPARGRDIALPDADLNAFQQLHAAIQQAWSNADVARLSQLVTPEMLSWFSQELARDTSQGVRNIVSGVEIVKGELTESWEEGDLQYATASMRWRALDYRVRLGRSPGDRDFLVAGDPRTPVAAEEVWTFVRRRGGRWLLSAIQQV
jgi:predicted lipid-binding transport protein (Tim44 family)